MKQSRVRAEKGADSARWPGLGTVSGGDWENHQGSTHLGPIRPVQKDDIDAERLVADVVLPFDQRASFELTLSWNDL